MAGANEAQVIQAEQRQDVAAKAGGGGEQQQLSAKEQMAKSMLDSFDRTQARH